MKKLKGCTAKKLREAVVSFTEAGGKREQFAAVQQLDFSGFTTAVHARANATKDLLNNADSLRDPFYYGSSQRDPLLLIITERFLYFLIFTERSLAIDPRREVLINMGRMNAWHPSREALMSLMKKP